MEILKFKETESEWWWCSGEIWFGLFQEYVKFYVVEAAEYNDVKSCAELISKLPEETCQRLCEESIAYCKEFSQGVGLEIPKFNHYEDVLKYVSNVGIGIPNPEEDHIPAFHVSMCCEWEIEHGLSWAVKGDEVIYVGPYDGSPETIDYFRNR